MSTGDISSHVQDIYGVSVSAGSVSRITDKLIPLIQEWQNRPLDPVYPFIFLDAVHYYVKEEKKFLDDIGENETSKFWLSIMTDLKNRGVKDILIASVDGLNGFDNSILSVFPQAQIQRCIVHQIRNILKYVNYKTRKSFAHDLKSIYTSPNEQAGIAALNFVKDL